MTTTKIAVLGATGQVGREILQCLADLSVPVTAVSALATAQSLGATVGYGADDELNIQNATKFDYATVDIVISAVPAVTAQEILPIIAKLGVHVIDCSPAFRMDPDVPLVVAGVNDKQLQNAKRDIAACPDASVCLLAQVLAPLHHLARLQRVVIATYQSASPGHGIAGRAGMDELFSQTRSVYVNDPIVKEQFPKQIAFNAIPQVGEFRPDGQTEAEFMLAAELKKVIDPKVKIAATAVRIASFVGTALAVTLELADELTVAAARDALRKQPGVIVVDHRTEEGYVTPVEVVGEDSVYVSRIRDDATTDNGLSLWIAGDSTRAGIAMNAARLALSWAGAAGARMPKVATVH